MENDLKMTVKGLPEELATQTGLVVAEVIKTFEKVDANLDLRRLHRIILTTDLGRELGDLAQETFSKNPITYTNEEYATAIAKVLILPHEDNHEILLVFNAIVAANLLPQNDLKNYGGENFDNVLHFLHHELYHVHDDNKKLDVLSEWMLRYSITGKDAYTFPVAEACWAEYFANLMSSSTVSESRLTTTIKDFGDALQRTKSQINQEILSYRFHEDLEKLMNYFRRHGEFLLKAAAYTLGYLDGLHKSLPDLSFDIAEKLSNSYFEPTWNAMQKALREMHELYPNGWKDLGIYDNLMTAIEQYYSEMGFILSNMEGDRVYISIPFRPETTPPEEAK
jgi:hypothetical protein